MQDKTTIFPKLRNSKYSRSFDVPNFPEKLESLPPLTNKDEDMSTSLINELSNKLKKLVVVVGPSGSGKTTLIREFFNTRNTLVSFTTRPPRNGEIHGRDYYFLSNDEVSELDAKHDFAEFVEYNNHKYGYTFDELIKKVDNDSTLACVATIDGYKHLKDLLGEKVVGIYLNISEKDVLANLQHRSANFVERWMLYNNEAKNIEFFKTESNVEIIDVTRDFFSNVDKFENALQKLI